MTSRFGYDLVSLSTIYRHYNRYGTDPEAWRELGDDFCAIGYQRQAERCYEQADKAAALRQSGFITDNHGHYWPRWCEICGGEMRVIRPGTARCRQCDGGIP